MRWFKAASNSDSEHNFRNKVCRKKDILHEMNGESQVFKKMMSGREFSGVEREGLMQYGFEINMLYICRGKCNLNWIGG